MIRVVENALANDTYCLLRKKLNANEYSSKDVDIAIKIKGKKFF